MDYDSLNYEIARFCEEYRAYGEIFSTKTTKTDLPASSVLTIMMIMEIKKLNDNIRCLTSEVSQMENSLYSMSGRQD